MLVPIVGALALPDPCITDSDCSGSDLCGRYADNGVFFPFDQYPQKWLFSDYSLKCYSMIDDGEPCVNDGSMGACRPDTAYCPPGNDAVCTNDRSPNNCNKDGLCYMEMICMDAEGNEQVHDDSGTCYYVSYNVGWSCSKGAPYGAPGPFTCYHPHLSLMCHNDICEYRGNYAGTPCGSPTNWCAVGLGCVISDDERICYEFNEEGEACDTETYKGCHTGLTCFNGLCAPGGLPGDTCYSDIDCRGLCRDVGVGGIVIPASGKGVCYEDWNPDDRTSTCLPYNETACAGPFFCPDGRCVGMSSDDLTGNCGYDGPDYQPCTEGLLCKASISNFYFNTSEAWECAYPGKGQECKTKVGCEQDYDCVRVSSFGGVVQFGEDTGSCRRAVGQDEFCGEETYCSSEDLFCDHRIMRCHTRGRIGTPCNTDQSCYEGHCVPPPTQRYEDLNAYCERFEAREDVKKRCDRSSLCDFKPISDLSNPDYPGRCIPGLASTCDDCLGLPNCCTEMANSGSLPTGKTCKYGDGKCVEVEADFHGWCESAKSKAQSTKSVLPVLALMLLTIL